MFPVGVAAHSQLQELGAVLVAAKQVRSLSVANCSLATEGHTPSSHLLTKVGLAQGGVIIGFGTQNLRARAGTSKFWARARAGPGPWAQRPGPWAQRGPGQMSPSGPKPCLKVGLAKSGFGPKWGKWSQTLTPPWADPTLVTGVCVCVCVCASSYTCPITPIILHL